MQELRDHLDGLSSSPIRIGWVAPMVVPVLMAWASQNSSAPAP